MEFNLQHVYACIFKTHERGAAARGAHRVAKQRENGATEPSKCSGDRAARRRHTVNDDEEKLWRR